MSENNVQLNDVTQLEGLNNLDFSDGLICDMETGVCGPADEIQNEKVKQVDEEK